MVYPDKKQIEEKTQELARLLRLYIRGISPATSIKNGLRCLFTDLVLEISNENDEHSVNCHFDTLIKGMI